MAEEKKLDPKYLEGLKFRSSEGKAVEEDGRKIMKYSPTERALRPDDVLDWKDYGDRVVIVTADGQKATVFKKDKPKKDDSKKDEK